MDAPAPKKHHVRATLAALYALGTTVPEEGIALEELRTRLASHLEEKTFHGLLEELQRRKVLTLALIRDQRTLLRGPEYTDGLERLRLTAEQMKTA
jgi:hypothetical protein